MNASGMDEADWKRVVTRVLRRLSHLLNICQQLEKICQTSAQRTLAVVALQRGIVEVGHFRPRISGWRDEERGEGTAQRENWRYQKTEKRDILTSLTTKLGEGPCPSFKGIAMARSDALNGAQLQWH